MTQSFGYPNLLKSSCFTPSVANQANGSGTMYALADGWVLGCGGDSRAWGAGHAEWAVELPAGTYRLLYEVDGKQGGSYDMLQAYLGTKVITAFGHRDGPYIGGAKFTLDADSTVKIMIKCIAPARYRLMLVEGTTPAAWAPAEGETLAGGSAQMSANLWKAENVISAEALEDGIYACSGARGVRTNVALDRLAENQVFHCGFSVNPGKDDKFSIALCYRDAAGSINYAWSDDVSATAGKWTRVSGSAVIPSGMTVYQMVICNDGNAPGASGWKVMNPTLSLGSPVCLASSAHTPYATQDHVSTVYATKASLKVTDDSVKAEVSARAQTDRNVADLSSRLTQTANSLTSEISDRRSAITTVTGLANAAQSTADAAKSSASNAVSTANSASTSAANAVKTANAASSSAASAVDTANSASSAASAASTAAGKASTDAASAVKTANSASSTASSAVTTANSAKSTANAASSTASAAKSTADGAAKQANLYTIGLGDAGAVAKWIHLGTLTSNGDASSATISIVFGSGFNGVAWQNSTLTITIKDGWQSTQSATGACGVTAMRENCDDALVDVLAQSATVYDVWVYAPWANSQGRYSISGNYAAWQHSGATQKAEPATSATQVKQDVAYRLADATKAQTMATENQSSIKQLSTSITAEVTARTQTDQNVADLSSRLTQTANSLTSEISDRKSAITTVTGLANAAQSTADSASEQTVELSSRLNQTATDITATIESKVQTVQQGVDGNASDVKNLNDRLSDEIRTRRSFMRFSEESSDPTLTLGQTDSPAQVKLTNKQLQFLYLNMVVAYMGGDALLINNAQILQQLMLGGFAVVPRSNGNLSLKWVGGES